DSNPTTARLDKYFERGKLMGTPAADNQELGGGKDLDLGVLPVSMHVIVAEKEMTLAEANGLVPGTIIELQRDKSNVVQLALNGRIVGHGELVDIDGKLGVRIAKWGVS